MPMDKQKWNPAQYAEEAHFVSELGAQVVDLLAPCAGERILDLGCGDGTLAKALHDAGCRVVGVDASPEMVAAAISTGVDARVVDGHALRFDAEFDAVFSNAALHWMTRPGLVLDGVYRALKPGGRFVGEFGGHGNVATILRALEEALAARGIDATLLNPWFFPRADEYHALLTRYGFDPVKVQAFSRPTPLPGDVTGWLETFAQSFINSLPKEARKAFVVEVVERCRPALCDGDGRWMADYARLRFVATRPSGASAVVKPNVSSA